MGKMIIRVDDFPTGVRPRGYRDLEPFEVVLYELEDFAKRTDTTYHVGVVPYLVSDRDLEWLNQFKYCIPVMHGLTHNYDDWNGINYPEFGGKSVNEISTLLNKGIIKLMKLSSFDDSIYIPPFNQITQKTVWALQDNGFSTITSGVDGYEIDTEELEVLTPRKHLYGRSRPIIQDCGVGTLDFNKGDHIALHLTWEAEILLEDNTIDCLRRLLQLVEEQL